MFEAVIDNSSKTALYADLCHAIAGITVDEQDSIANMANTAALIWEYVPDLNWAGFYRLIGGELVLGPFQGKSACIRIPLGKGVCGAAAITCATQLVDDVHAFPGHIACDARSRSELVVPIVGKQGLIAVLDMDSPLPARFEQVDAEGFEAIAAVLSKRICPESGQF